MKKYIKPTMKVKPLEMENCILAGSISVGISEDPATGPALSKGNNFFDDEDDDEEQKTRAKEKVRRSILRRLG